MATEPGSLYDIPMQAARAEIEVLNSRFIASLEPAFSVEEARTFISRMRAEFHNATHNVPAFIIGGGSSAIAHCSDAGEPAGTAGRPALAVLQGSGLGDVVVVVTRYFGGTKLGAGGVVRAYGDSVRAVLPLVMRGRRISVSILMLGLPYALFDQVRLLVAAQQGDIVDQDFAGEVTLTLRFPQERAPTFQNALSELSNGKLRAELIEETELVRAVC